MMTTDVAKVEKKLTKKDVLKSWLRYYAVTEVGNSYERLTALAFGFGMAPVLEKLYGDNEEELKKAYARHVSFYNSEGTWGFSDSGYFHGLGRGTCKRTCTKGC